MSSLAATIPIARFTEGPMALVVNDQTPYKTLKDFVDDAKKRPNEIVFSSSGLYGALHLPAALFMKAAGIQLRHLPTNGGGPAMPRERPRGSARQYSSLRIWPRRTTA